jgi:hypothetical protein
MGADDNVDNKAEGKAKETVGDAAGDEQMQAEGQTDQARQREAGRREGQGCVQRLSFFEGYAIPGCVLGVSSQCREAPRRFTLCTARSVP